MNGELREYNRINMEITTRNAIHDKGRKFNPTLHNRFECSVDPETWRWAINNIKLELNK